MRLFVAVQSCLVFLRIAVCLQATSVFFTFIYLFFILTSHGAFLVSAAWSFETEGTATDANLDYLYLTSKRRAECASTSDIAFFLITFVIFSFSSRPFFLKCDFDRLQTFHSTGGSNCLCCTCCPPLFRSTAVPRPPSAFAYQQALLTAWPLASLFCFFLRRRTIGRSCYVLSCRQSIGRNLPQPAATDLRARGQTNAASCEGFLAKNK